jgi:hypothetical protein
MARRKAKEEGLLPFPIKLDLTPEMDAALGQLAAGRPEMIAGFLLHLAQRLGPDGVSGLPATLGAMGIEGPGNFLTEELGSLVAGPDDDYPGPVEGICFSVTITLEGTAHPKVVRKLEVPDMTFADLHDAIQAAMGWQNSHLHEFRIGREISLKPMVDPLGMPFDWGMEDDDAADEARVGLSELPPELRRKITYIYDFGDSWEHTIKLSEAKPIEPDVVYPRCVGGSGACPPEDCGGVWGYNELLDILALPAAERSPDDRERLEWAGELDPNAFSIEAVNTELGKVFKSLMKKSKKKATRAASKKGTKTTKSQPRQG